MGGCSIESSVCIFKSVCGQGCWFPCVCKFQCVYLAVRVCSSNALCFKWGVGKVYVCITVIGTLVCVRKGGKKKRL